MVPGWLNLWRHNRGYGGPTISYTTIFDCMEGHTSNSHIVQGSTVIDISLHYSCFSHFVSLFSTCYAIWDTYSKVKGALALIFFKLSVSLTRG